MAEAKPWCFIPHSKEKGTKIELEALPLVLCKDCKHYDGEGTCLKIGIALLHDTWFCADGEEKDD